MSFLLQAPTTSLLFTIGARPLIALVLLAVAVTAGILIDRMHARRFSRTQL